MLKFKQFVEHLDEVSTQLVSGTKAGWTTHLDHKEYLLTSDVKGAKIGDYVNVVLPKGTTITNLPGGVFASHKTLKDKYCTGYKSQRWDDKFGVQITSLPDTLTSIEKSSRIVESVEFVNEGGNAVESRPMTQDEAVSTFDYVVKKILPLIGLDKDSAKPIGSFNKKMPDQLSGDLDIACSMDRIAGVNGIALGDVLDFVEGVMKKNGITVVKSVGFNQVSIGVPIAGKATNGIAQVDLMMTSSLDWSTFMYHSPDFRAAESKYKGMYRNVLLMSIVSECKKEATKLTDTGETQEYKQFVIRLGQGIFEVTKTLMGAKGLVKTAKLLHDQDKFVTNTPEAVTEIAFGANIQPSDIMTFENIWKHFTDKNFIHKDKFDAILQRFKIYILSSKVPVPTEVENDFPNLFN